MSSLTLNIDEGTLRRARIRALEQGTTVNALVREYLESFAGESPATEGLRGFLAIAERAHADSGKGGRRWTRDDAHAR
jgi:plasmid stability protein